MSKSDVAPVLLELIYSLTEEMGRNHHKNIIMIREECCEGERCDDCKWDVRVQGRHL